MANTLPSFESPVPRSKPSLFDKGHRYTPTAAALYAESYKEMKDIFKAYFNMGHSPREVAHIMQEVARDLESEAVLSNG